MFSVFAMDRVVNTLFDIWCLLHIQPEDCQMNIIRPKFPLKKCYNFNIFVGQSFFTYLIVNFSYNIIVNFPKQLPHHQIFWLSYFFKFIACYWWISYFMRQLLTTFSISFLLILSMSFLECFTMNLMKYEVAWCMNEWS